MSTITVEYKNNAEEWWDAANELAKSMRDPTFSRIYYALMRSNTIGDDVIRGELDGFLETARKLPGWDSGSPATPNPIFWTP